MAYASELVANIDADTRRFDQKAAGVDRTLKRLADSDPEVTVNVDDRNAQADIRGIQTALDAIGDEEIAISADAADARSEVQTVEAALAGIEDEAVLVSADAAQARGEVQTVEAALAGIEDQDVRVTADTQAARADVQSLEASLAGLEDQTVQVTTQASGMGASFGAAASQSGMLGGAVGGVVGKVGMLKAGIAGLAGSAAVGTFYKLGSGALELADTVNATNVVFGDSREIIDTWASDSVNKVGLSERAFRDLSAPLGAVMRSLGATGDEVAKLSNEAVSLGADFASVFGGSTQDAVMAIGAAFRGETEPIRRYGITLSAAAIQERALSMGLVDGSGKIRNRAAVVRDLIVEQAEANGIVGDFNKTQDEGVNTIRGASAALADAKDAWGTLFAPAVEKAAVALKGFAEASVGAVDTVGAVGGAAWDAFNQVVPLEAAFGAAGDVIGWLGGKSGEAAAPVRELTAEQYNMAEAARTGRSTSDELATGVDGVGEAAGNARTGVRDLKDALNDLIGVHISAEEAQIKFEEALNTARESLQENGHHLDGTSEKTLKVRGDVASMAQAALGAAEALKEQRAGHTVVNESLTTARQRMIDLMVAEGMTRGAAEAHLTTLGFSKEALDRVAASTNEAKHRTKEMQGAIDTARGATYAATGVFGGWIGTLGTTAASSTYAESRTYALKGSVESSTGSAWRARDAFGNYGRSVVEVPNNKTTTVHTPGLAEGLQKLTSFRDVLNSISSRSNFNFNVTAKGPSGPPDGPGGPIAPRGGKALSRVQAILGAYPGTRITSTYRSPARNRAAGGSPTSYHMDANNPAVDIGGPTYQLHRIAAALRAAGGWRELLWQVRGHYDHVHVAHAGGMVDPSWATDPRLRSDERPVIAQVGEGILSRADMASLATSGGSVAPVVAPVSHSSTVHVHINAPVYGVHDLQAAIQQAVGAHDRTFLDNLDQMGVRRG